MLQNFTEIFQTNKNIKICPIIVLKEIFQCFALSNIWYFLDTFLDLFRTLPIDIIMIAESPSNANKISRYFVQYAQYIRKWRAHKNLCTSISSLVPRSVLRALRIYYKANTTHNKNAIFSFFVSVQYEGRPTRKKN